VFFKRRYGGTYRDYEKLICLYSFVKFFKQAFLIILSLVILSCIDSPMPRIKLIRQSTFPYHVTTRTNNKSWFDIPIFEVWDICKLSLIYALKKRPVEINSFVLMSNHYHLLVTTPNEDIDQFMMYFNLRLSQLITKKSGHINHKFSNGYKWSIVEHRGHLFNVYRYIYQNPVRAKITSDCFSYPYSSLHFSRFEAKLLNYVPHIQYSREKSLLERSFGNEFNKVMKSSLSKTNFKASNSVSKYLRNILEKPRD